MSPSELEAVLQKVLERLEDDDAVGAAELFGGLHLEHLAPVRGRELAALKALHARCERAVLASRARLVEELQKSGRSRSAAQAYGSPRSGR